MLPLLELRAVLRRIDFRLYLSFPLRSRFLLCLSSPGPFLWFWGRGDLERVRSREGRQRDALTWLRSFLVYLLFVLAMVVGGTFGYILASSAIV